MKKLKIYLCDITHDTVGLATEVFPLNIGFIGSYCKMKHGDAVDITLFKYIKDIENAISSQPPDLIAFSNYPWCHNANLALSDDAITKNKNTIVVMGGPNFPHNLEDQKSFLILRGIIDKYVYLDGEIGFSNIINKLLEMESLSSAKKSIRDLEIEGSLSISSGGDLITGGNPERIKELDEIPSPYLSGLLDKFFDDGRLSPMIQTNRGCPFTCSFCADGNSAVNKVNSFSTERVMAELEYIAKRVNKSVRSLFISDLNFGMFKRDVEIAKFINNLKIEYGFPNYVDATTGKNSKERVIKSIENLSGSLQMTMAVQSLDQKVLKNIKRENIRISDYVAIQPAIKKADLKSYGEIILGLPGETIQSHLSTINQMLKMQVDYVVPHSLMMLNGAEMNIPEQRELYGYKTKFRIIPRDFSWLKSGKAVVEIEEVAIATSTLPFEDYLMARKIALILSLANNPGVGAFLKYLSQENGEPIDLIQNIILMLEDAKNLKTSKFLRLKAIVDEFVAETKDELWDSEQELISFYQDRDNFDRLINGVDGKNLIQTYVSKVISECMDDFVDLAYFSLKNVLAEIKVNQLHLDHLHRYCLGKTYMLFDPARNQKVFSADFSIDIPGWMSDPESKTIEHFLLPNEKTLNFEISTEQFEELNKVLDLFGHGEIGRSKAIIRVGPNTLWRGVQWIGDGQNINVDHFSRPSISSSSARH